MASSPHSTDENTNHGSPSTNLTAFTPEADFGSKGRVSDFVRPVLKLRPTNPKHASVCDESEEDVFLTAPVAAKGQQLSPTAEVFTPKLSNGFMKKEGQAQAGYVDRAQDTVGSRMPAKFAYFPVNVPGAPRPSQVPAVNPNAARYGFGLLKLDETPFNHVAGIFLHDFDITEGVFSLDEGISRSFVVTGVPLQFTSQVVSRHFPIEYFPSIRGINSTAISSGLFVVSCADIRDAKRAADVANAILPYSYIFPLKAKKYTSDNGGDPSLVTDHEGQVIVSIYYNGHATAPPVEAAPIVAEVRRLLAQCGDVKAFHTIPTTQTHVREIRVEFFNADLVEVAKDVIRGTIIHGAVLDVASFQPDVRVVTELDEEHHEQLSVTGRSRVPFDPDYDRIAYAIQRDGLRNGRRLNQAMNHNAVDIARIQAGLDVRTTIMLRNIPNRVDQPMLKNLLDVTSRGRYDFMYLRIGKLKLVSLSQLLNCSQHWQISQTTAMSAMPSSTSLISSLLAPASAGTASPQIRLPRSLMLPFKERIVLSRSFETLPSCLSTLAFAPRQLFVAGNVQNAGQEEKFPEPDNHSKMRRSVENAEHVGLYLPLRLNPGWYPVPNPGAAAFRRRRPMRRTGRFNVAEIVRNGVYMPPARANKPTTSSPPKASANKTSPTRRRVPFFIDTRNPYDPFAGRPRRTFSP
ncbi:hypothetical protein Z517_10588 [Fonsecaea pedrosoi CBS 271.37]|uniref:Unplaced genomic scaffold supercont1.7, whole genome shotgun sequence n=1 Tax=Fonsecaea pedrosoi CBS 271.37 TaxID=1442368 RepID=A0A0D2G568_9EURO|nr:uncharacterized protein Z517_10588 [Fonsecaea pedrosoi CBS 271.37]KIW75843.1 hypothetical protein Z517_10588 [Fonsecaea pedrosoi CBS 271.37]